MPHTVFGLPFWTVAVIFVAIWMGLDLVHKDENAVERFVIAVQSIAIVIGTIFLAIQILQWTRTI